MSSANWGFSSSSDNESDDGRTVTKFRTDSLFYQQFHRGEYGCDFPNVNLGATNHRTNIQANSSVLNGENDLANSSFANISRIPGLNESRILSPGLIMENTLDDIVLINEGGKFRPMRVISQKELLTPRKTPDGKKTVRFSTKYLNSVL